MNYRAFCLFASILFGVAAQAGPVISSFTPTYGSSATYDPYIYISGSGFGSGTSGGTLKVYFNGVADPSAYATLANGTLIQAHVPASAPLGFGPVGVSVNGSATVYSTDDFNVIGPGPYITGFNPPVGDTGTSVQIYGAHFAAPGTMIVKFNGVSVPSANITTNSEIMITVIAPAGITSGPISVGKIGNGTNITSTNFMVPPIIKSFSPINGRTGTNVVIKGTNFFGATSVRIGSIATADFSIDSNFQITARVPTNAVTGTLRVNTPAGSSTTSSNFSILPTITGFTPGSGPAGTAVTITGANFDAGSLSVKFNGVAASAGTPTFGSVTVTAPVSTTGPIVLTTAGGSVTSSVSFYYPPVITGFTPTNSAALSRVTISGTNFTDASVVTFNGNPAISFNVTNNNVIGATVPINVITGPINVTTPGGTSNSAGLFYGMPSIDGFTPSQGAPGSAVTLTGTNFLGAIAILFGGSNAVFTVTNNNVLSAKVPTNAPSGPITIIAPGGTNTSAGIFTILLTNDISVGVVDSPDPVFVTSNLTYTITVANSGPFAAANVMVTNQLPASVTLKSASSSQGNVDTNASPITAALGTISKGAIATVTLTVVPHVSGWITNVATIGSDYPDPTLYDHTNAIGTLVWPSALLSIRSFSNNLVQVSWPAPLSNFFLLYKTNLLLTNNWSTNLSSRALTSTNISVTDTNFGDIKFYRLRQ